ncbi:MAG: M13 family metallopeptidase [Eubacterium sp.]|nr:M13 family metallopeptidase [Eubacterium sp.]
MKKRFIPLTLAACTIMTAFTGCGADTNGETTASSVQIDTQSIADDIATADLAEEDVHSEIVDTATASTAEADSDSEVVTGGSPWIDSDIKENVTADTVADPKDDFHLYANKDWILENDIPEGTTSWDRGSARSKEVKKQCMDLLKDDSVEGHDAELVRTYNKLILDWDARNKLGVSELQEKYDKIVNAQSIDDISKLLTEEDTVYDFNHFVKFDVAVGLNDPGKNIVFIETPNLMLDDSAEYANRTELGDVYYGYNKETFIYMAPKLGMTEEEADKCFDDAIAFETKLASKIYTTEEQYADDYYDKVNNEMSLDEVVSNCNNFPLNDIINSSGFAYDGTYLVTTPDYLKNLDEIYTEENLNEIKSLMIVDYVLEDVAYLDRDTYEKLTELENNYFGSEGSVSDEEMACSLVKKNLPDSYQKVYVEKYGSEEDKQKMEDLCKMVIDTYRELLSENEWASDEAKKLAIEKLDNMKVNVAYPDKFNDTSDINIEGCSLLEATHQIKLNKIKESIKCMGKEKDTENWASEFPVTICNAYYSPQGNSINMPIGLFGGEFYSDDMSIEELYASIGAYWVGHEVSHAFDRDGAQFDKDGNFRDWMPEADKEEFQKRIDKMDKYLDSLIAFGDEHFIGTNNDVEMTADMTGLQCALKMASKIDGFDYKKFFIKYAQLQVNLASYNSELHELTQDMHPLAYSRTNVPVQQFEEFYDAFDVKEGDNMYLAPEERIVVW